MVDTIAANAPQAPGGGKREWVREWARRGFPVFPLIENGKEPKHSIGWTTAATTDPAALRTWWTDPVVHAGRDLNIGVLTSDYTVLDIDVKNGKPGLEAMLRLGIEFGDTLTIRTPTGGYHLYYQKVEPVAGCSPLCAGIDVKAFNGYVCGPGSTINGGEYVVEFDVPVAPFPEHLRGMLKPPAPPRVARNDCSVELDLYENVEAARHFLTKDAPPAIEGRNGNDTTFKVCCGIRDYGVSEATALELFLETYNLRCEPPWSDTEATRLVENAYRFAKGQAGARSFEAAFGHVVLPPYPPSMASPGTTFEGRAEAQSPSTGVLETVTGADLAERELRPREWLVENVVYANNVALLYGDGGVGKSTLALQMAVAVAAGCEWLGWPVLQTGPAIYFSAEDDLDEAHRRLTDICRSCAVPLDTLQDLLILPLTDEDPTLVVGDQRSDTVTPRPLWSRLVQTVEHHQPRLLVVDNLGDAFAGNQNSATQPRQFIGMLRRLAMSCRVTVVVLAHPSLHGMSSGTGTSGSTSWSNCVRSRLYFKRPDGDPFSDLRVLTVQKVNYGRVGTEMHLRWSQGAFKPLPGASGEGGRAAREAKVDEVFLTLLDRLAALGRNVSQNAGPTYAPSVLVNEPGSEDIEKAAFKAAMGRLLRRGQIESEQHGRKGHKRWRLIRVCSHSDGKGSDVAG